MKINKEIKAKEPKKDKLPSIYKVKEENINKMMEYLKKQELK